MATLHPPEIEEEHDDHGGLHRDIPALVGRRDMLKMMGGLSLAGLLAACNVSTGSSTTAAAVGSTTTTAGATTTSGGGSSTTTEE